jgi:nitroreductase/FMN reductase (NADPH)/FMN reductase [NAD(P)H]
MYMNEVIKNLMERKSVRSFTDQKISEDDLKTILEAASNAPSAGNQQMYTILHITDQKIKERLAETCDHQPFIAKAPLVLVFLADVQKWYNAFRAHGCNPRKPGPGDLMLAVDDTLIAAQNAVTAAQSLGIGSCYIGDVMEQCEVHRELLKLPDYVFPAALVVFGYPTQQQVDRPKPERCPLPILVHENTYPSMSKDELSQLLRANERKTAEETFQAFHKRKYDSDFAREMTRSVNEFVKTFQADDETED